MKKLIYCLLLLFISMFAATHGEKSVTYITTPLDSAEGKAMFLQSEYRDAYWPLSQYYLMQNRRLCGPASAAMVLNALKIPRPLLWEGSNLFTQDNFFSDAIPTPINKEVVAKVGMSLEELSKALESWGVVIKTVYANELTDHSFRELLKEYLAQTDRFIISNFIREALDQSGGGHFSPIAAYDQKSDTVLILDVNQAKYAATWVQLPRLLLAMQAATPSGLPRGLILAQRNFSE